MANDSKVDSGADDIVQEAMDAFKCAEEAESENRQNAKEDIQFARMGEQWSTKDRNDRQLAGRPCLTINQLLPAIRQVVNDSRQNRPSAKVHPVDSGSDPETAEVLGGMIRNIENTSDAEVAYDTAIDHAVSGGFGYWRINLDYALNALDEDGIRAMGPEAFDKNIFIRRIANPFSVFGDPYSQAADSADWNQAHVIDTLTCDQFRKKYPGAEETDFDGGQWSTVNAPWKDGDNVQVAEYWKREEAIRNALMVQLGDTEEGPGDVVIMMEDEYKGQKALLDSQGASVIGSPRPIKGFKVTQYIVSGVEELDKVEWAGSYIPIIPVYGDEVNIEGRRHLRSLIRDAKDSQRMVNYWNTTATEVVALAPRAPYMMEEGSIPKGWAGKWATANSHSHPYLMYTRGTQMPQRTPFTGTPGGMMEMALFASDSIKSITGIHDASLGARSNETSGVAIRARQMEGDNSTFHFIDNLSRAIRHSGRVIIDLIPKVYTSERIVRILGEDGKASVVGLNGAVAEAQTAIHDVRTGRYDVTVTAGPSFTSRREEAASQMMELVRQFPQAAEVIGDLIAKNLDWPGADEIAKRLETLLPAELKDGEGQVPPAIQQQLQQLSGALQEMGQKLQAAEDKRDLEQQKLAIERYKAETERMKDVAPAMGAEAVQALVFLTLQDLFTDDGPPPFGQVGPDLPNGGVVPIGPSGEPQPGLGQAA